MSTATEPFRLTHAEKSELRGLIARNPEATRAEVVALFRERTGRTISTYTVGNYKPRLARGPRPAAPPPDPRAGWFAHLPEAERRILLRLYDAHPRMAPIDLVALFLAEAEGVRHA